MNASIAIRMGAAALSVALGIPIAAIAQEHAPAQNTRYTIVDLGPVGGPPGQPFVINNVDLAAGAAAAANGSMHAALWLQGLKIDIGAHGLGGPNSMAFGVNETGETVGAAQGSDPNSEDFCGFNAYGLPHSNTSCLPFVWRYGGMTRLPTLGGPDGAANMINRQGDTVGFAETTVQERNCSVFQFKPVVWRDGKAHALPTFAGDPDGVAAWINDKGQIVGSSGTCAPFNSNSQLYLSENHALLWENGTVIDLGNLGGTGGIAGNHACAINNRGQIVGHSELRNDTSFHGFLWSKETRMQDLGTLAGDYASIAVGINDRGTVVGASLDANFNSRAYVWENGGMTDLNTLVHGSSALYLLLAQAINDRGEIVGLGVTSAGEAHGFAAIPARCDDDAAAAEVSEEPIRPVLSDSARQRIQQELGRHYPVGGLK